MLASKHRGFTLLELLVVVIIISFFFAMIGLAIRDTSADRLEKEIDRLQALIKFTQEKALFENTNIGMHFFQAGYGFIIELTVPDPNNPSEDIQEYFRLDTEHRDKTFRVRYLPDEMRLNLLTEQTDLLLNLDWPDPEDELEPLLPHVMFYSSGENTPFDVELIFNETIAQRLQVDTLGKITLEQIEAL